ncbi:hypothetical protein FNF31_02583 [Cafeteria roenbergensis]|uniref:Uncharacterized protein n=2 Tax=Cafeteria roenbergensis TaxID=33653 RepID=A0A5A8DHD6_CAFRO|nr:hypothetical protein FNF31_02583 [Cafeteria roenbergensis]
MRVIQRSGSVLRTTSLTFVDVGALPVALCTVVALGLAVRSGSRCYHENPDVRRQRWTLHEPLPADDVAVAGTAWRAAARRRHLGRDTCNVSCWSVLGLRRPDALEEFFPEAALAE